MLSNKRENFSAGGGLLNNVDATVVNARSGIFTYPSGQQTTAAFVSFQSEDGREEEAMYSVGNPLLIQPSANKKGFEPVDPRKDGKPAITKLPGGSNWSHFIEELEESDFDSEAANFDEDLTVLIGTKGHIVRINQKARDIKDDDGEPKKATKQGTILVFNKVTQSGGGLPKAGSSKKEETGPETELAEITRKAATLAVADLKAPLARKEFATACYNKVLSIDSNKKHLRAPVRQKILADDAFLNALVDEGVLEFDGENVIQA